MMFHRDPHKRRMIWIPDALAGEGCGRMSSGGGAYLMWSVRPGNVTSGSCNRTGLKCSSSTSLSTTAVRDNRYAVVKKEALICNLNALLMPHCLLSAFLLNNAIEAGHNTEYVPASLYPKQCIHFEASRVDPPALMAEHTSRA